MSRYRANAFGPPSRSFTIAALDQAEQFFYYLRRRIHARYVNICALVFWARVNPDAARRSLSFGLATSARSPLNGLILLWILLLCWGEIWSFDNKIASCDWSRWENWTSDANPHHVAFIADPQLVDPHTYPGRPWPLSALTVKHTDLYMRRSYSRIQRKLDPDTILFLGDYFDGGREWATPKSQSPEYMYRQYGDEFWLAEFERFSSLFLREWKPDSARSDTRRIIASLPGNHDIGLGRGIKIPVRDRFVAHFGESNRIDIIGNHTFAQVDSISLTAAEQAGAGEYGEIWGPPNHFIESFAKMRATAVAHHLSHIHNLPHPKNLNSHDVVEMDDPSIVEKEPLPGEPGEGIPTVLLSHVPLYREPGEACGPKRERWPVYPNSLSITAGYQYQNVLSGQISKAIVDKMGGTVEYAFSGDDHDYCEVVHKDLASPGAGIREITVKSISEAMGVRRPGFVLSSLWNPIDANGKRIKSSLDSASNIPTLQSHLCLLPDEIGIIIRYLIFTLISAILLFARAVRIVFPSYFSTPPRSILPLASSAKREKSSMNGGFMFHQHSSPTPENHQAVTAGTSSLSDEAAMQLSARAANSARPRSASPLPPHGPGADESSSAYTWTAKRNEPWFESGSSTPSAYARTRAPAWEQRQGKLRDVFIEWGRSIWYVARVAVAWYVILFNWW